MIPVYSERHGDCFSACVASILELRYEEVPMFFDGAGEDRLATQEEDRKLREWFNRRGLAYVEFGWQQPPVTVMQNSVQDGPDLIAILSGTTASGSLHSVVIGGGLILHDPGLAATVRSPMPSLVAPRVDGFSTLGFITVMNPRLLKETYRG